MRYLIPQDDACSGKTRYADTALFWCISLAFVTAGAIAWAETKWPGCAGQFIRTLNCRNQFNHCTHALSKASNPPRLAI